MGAPDTYRRHAWDDDETNDGQWPYRVWQILGTDLLNAAGHPAGNPEDETISHEISLNSASTDYQLGSINLLTNGDMAKIAKAFMQPSEIADITLTAGSVLATVTSEDKVQLRSHADGTLSYSYSANGTGFWCTANGSAGSWGDSSPVFRI